MSTEEHEKYYVLEATILAEVKDINPGERKVWVKYSKEKAGAPSYVKIFKFKNPQIIPTERAQPPEPGEVLPTHQFKEIAIFENKLIGFATSSNPLINSGELKNIRDKKKMETNYFRGYTPEHIFLPKGFPHRNA